MSSETPDPPRRSLAEELGGSLSPRTALSPVVTAGAILILGSIAICVSFVLAPIVMSVGSYTVGNTSNHLTGVGGLIWVVSGPLLPYVLLGFVVARVGRYSKSFWTVRLTAAMLCIVTLAFHIFSGYLERLGEYTELKGLVEYPAGFGFFYLVVGVYLILLIVDRFGPPELVPGKWTGRNANTKSF